MMMMMLLLLMRRRLCELWGLLVLRGDFCL